MTITGTDARYTGSWEVDLAIEPGSVPDRLTKYARNTAASYRPVKLRLVFKATAVASSAGELAPEKSRPLMAGGAKEVWLHDGSVSGPRLRQDGSLSKTEHTERMYTSLAGMPDWVTLIVAQITAELASS